MGIANALSELSTEFQDTKKMHEAATKIQFWVRKKLSKETIIPMELEKKSML